MKADNYFDIDQAISNPKCSSLYETSPDRNNVFSNFNTRWCEPLTAFFLSTNAPYQLSTLRVYM